ncbi:saccharopine dehydrogenase family protein [Arenimonas daejeonensis]|uniref:saccharopine dehydrogenase family protein n=1 Tax=Arenimonas daejeonensis TaxID=370777 RepID=UPI001D14324B|nr:saccharopine dehydrogenase NADP-binding domain-containing protein [Arenimonas daejeonensis]
MEWMIYGANGYTGKLIVEEAVRRGLRPVLAGRNSQALQALAAPFGLPVRAFGLDDPHVVAKNLHGMGLVLHCAGPFSATCAPMLEGCLAEGVHYLDITGEIDVFAHCHAQHLRAREKGIVVLPGSGFDVVPTDCMAARLKRELPAATSLVLAFEAGGGPSPGTAKTSVEGLGKGGRARVEGELTRCRWPGRRAVSSATASSVSP